MITMHILYLSNWAATYVSFTYFLIYLLYWYFQTLDQMDVFLEDECSHIAERWSRTLKKKKNLIQYATKQVTVTLSIC